MNIFNLYYNDIDKYYDYIEDLYNSISNNFYGKGINPQNISKLLFYIKKEIYKYLKTKYNKDYKIIITLIKDDNKIIKYDSLSDDIIKIRLLYEKINNILKGSEISIIDYLKEIFDQLEVELESKKRFSFINYLIIQMKSLVELAYIELQFHYKPKDIESMIIDKTSWIILSNSSKVFKDYYMTYIQENNKKVFYCFIKLLLKKCIENEDRRKNGE